MTTIYASATNQSPITPDDIRPYYNGTTTNPHLGGTPKIGLEVEHTLFNQTTHQPISLQQNTALLQKGRAQNITVNLEPSASILELTSAAYLPDDLPKLLKALCEDAHGLHDLAASMDIGISPFGQLPATKLKDHTVVDLERYQTFFAPPRDDMQHVYLFFASCLNIQSSVSYHDADHLLRIIRMSTALEPILFLSTDSSSGFSEGKPHNHVHNIAHKDKLGVNAGIPNFYYSAKTGDELIDQHIHFTLTHPHIFAYFNHNNKLTRLPKGWTSFNQLEAQNLGPQNVTNYLQAQSESWRRACNIATIQDENGTLLGHRAELAAFQTGLMHQRATAASLTYFIAFDEIFYDQTTALLRDFGIDLNNLEACKPLLEHNFQKACYHNNQYHTLPFGTATIKDFTTKFADIIEAAADRANLSNYTAPIQHIMRSGRPDWLVYREKFQTLEDTLNYMHNFNRYLQDTPDLISPWTCADMTLKNIKQM